MFLYLPYFLAFSSAKGLLYAVSNPLSSINPNGFKRVAFPLLCLIKGHD